MMYADSAVVGDAKYLKRKVKSGHVSLDASLGDLVLTYEVEASVVGESGRAMQTERKTHKTPLRVRVDAHTDVGAYALQLVQSNELIPNNRVDHVRDLLQQLKDELLAERKRADPADKVARDVEVRRKEEERARRRAEREREAAEAERAALGTAEMAYLDEYVELLYEEEAAARVRGTGLILQLASEAGNLEALLDNDALMGALSRTLKEDYKRSYELALNIMRVFVSLSTFSQFHACLQSFQAGNCAMQIIKWELEKWEARARECESCETAAHGDDVESRAKQDKLAKLVRKQDKLLIVCLRVLLNLAEDDKVEKKMARRELVPDLVRILGAQRASSSGELLTMGVAFLKKLSVTRENVAAMRDADCVPGCLARLIGCSSETLHKLVLATLLNLGFDPASRAQMVEAGLAPRLVLLLQDKQLRAQALKLLYQLSIDDATKATLAYTELVPYVMRMCAEFPGNLVAKELAALAINLTHNARCCAIMCANQNTFRVLVDRAIKRRDPLLIKVVRNLSRWTLTQQEELPDTSPDAVTKSSNAPPQNNNNNNNNANNENSSQNAAQPSFGYKMRRLWETHVHDICKLITTADNPAVMVEAIGTLANLSPKDLPRATSYADLIIEHDLVEFMHKHLMPGFAEDDVLLEIVVLVGQLCISESAGRLLANSPLVKLIYDLLHEKKDDTEITLQVLFTFHRLLRHNDTGHALLYETQMPRDVCQLLASNNTVVRAMADALLDLIIDHDEANETAININRRLARKATRSSDNKNNNTQQQTDDEEIDHTALNPDGYSELRGALSRMVRAKRFHIHNAEWIDAIAQDQEDDTRGDNTTTKHAKNSAFSDNNNTYNYTTTKNNAPKTHIDHDHHLDEDDIDDEHFQQQLLDH